MSGDVLVLERSTAGGFELPTTGDSSKWTEDQKALLDAAGLVVRKKGRDPVPAPRSTVVAFLAHCRRTGLDPIARQIYAIERGGKWGIQVSIDGFRLVAERSRQYGGQVPVQWTADGETWVDVWVSDEPPAAARVGVIRRDFTEVLYAVARFKAYAVYDEEWVGEYPNRRKTGNKTLSDMWARMHAEQIAKVAEALALRKAFPMELSGLYTDEEMDQANSAPSAPPAQRGSGPTLEAGTRSAQRDPLPDVPPEPEAPSGEPTTPEVTLYDCTRCGQPGATDPDGGICPACEVEIEAEMAGVQS